MRSSHAAGDTGAFALATICASFAGDIREAVRSSSVMSAQRWEIASQYKPYSLRKSRRDFSELDGPEPARALNGRHLVVDLQFRHRVREVVVHRPLAALEDLGA